MRGRLAAGWLVVAGIALAGCTVEQVHPIDAATSDGRTDTHGDDTGSSDEGVPDEGGPDTPVSDVEWITCEQNNPKLRCPDDLFCLTQSGVCVECLVDYEKCSDDGVRHRCDAPVEQDGELISGGFYYEAPCDPGQVCDPESPDAACADVICTPGERTCADDFTMSACSALGNKAITKDCPKGTICASGQCRQVPHNVLLIFDTSGSMYQYIGIDGVSPAQCNPDEGMPCPPPWPQCVTADQPLTLLDLAKMAFADTLNETVGDHVRYALQRFPQVENCTAVQPNCMSGWYEPVGLLTDDDDSRDTTQGIWFERYRHQALVVPFTRRLADDNRAELMSWMDFNETRTPSNLSCTSHADCVQPNGAKGGCVTYNEQRLCLYHAENELRVGGETPLGKSIFYAGEYFRRDVLIDGKACTDDLDCNSAGYRCCGGECRDPYRHCKENHIVLFTDGYESEHPLKTEQFFNPVVQAKRLAYGLDCDYDTDCRGDATCKGGICVGPDQLASEYAGLAPSEGFDALSASDGGPIAITTSVLTLQQKPKANSNNDAIAAAGGGISVQVASTDDQALADALQNLLRPAFKCEADPEFTTCEP